MKIKKELVKRDIAGDIVLVPVGKTVYEANGVFVLNDVGAFLWDRLSEADGAEDLTAAVLAEYEVTAEEARRDIDEFLDTLHRMAII